MADWWALANVGPWGIIGFVVLCLVRGWLVPRRVHLDRIADLKEALAAKDATIAERERQIGILLAAPRQRTGGR